MWSRVVVGAERLVFAGFTVISLFRAAVAVKDALGNEPSPGHKRIAALFSCGRSGNRIRGSQDGWLGPVGVLPAPAPSVAMAYIRRRPLRVLRVLARCYQAIASEPS